MKKMLLGALVATSAVLMLTGCQHPSTGDGRTWTPSELASMSPSPSATTAPTATATPDAPQPSFPVASPSATASAAPIKSGAAAKALSQLASLKVAEANYSLTYNRTKDFGPAWEDVDHNGCDTRNDILRRDLTNITYKSNDPGCTVATGTLADPYTGETINFVRGQGTSLAIQVDHLSPLHYVWMHGAADWTQERREAYANDPFVLLAVDGPANGQKSDKGPADWLPSNEAYHCTYVEKFVAVEAKYNLTISRRDAATSRRILSTCE